MTSRLVTALQCLWTPTPGVRTPTCCSILVYTGSQTLRTPHTGSRCRHASFHNVVMWIHAHRYSGHSFRRGGATLALACGVPVSATGVWRSPDVERYPDISLYQAATLHRHYELHYLNLLIFLSYHVPFIYSKILYLPLQCWNLEVAPSNLVFPILYTYIMFLTLLVKY